MNSPAKDLAKWLAGQGGLGAFGAETDFSVYAIMEPEQKPSQVVTLYDTGGGGPDTDDLNPHNVTFQVRTRCARYSDGYDIQVIIRDLLLASQPACEDSTFLGIMMTSDVAGIGRDENNRFLLTANYAAIRNL